MRVLISWSFFCILLMLSSFMAGCTITMGDFIPNSNFAYPNSNIEPLGRVSAEVSKTRVFSAQIVDKEMLDEVIKAALTQKGGDILLNYKINTDVTNILNLVFTTTLRVDGTAAKMTVGRQELR